MTTTHATTAGRDTVIPYDFALTYTFQTPEQISEAYRALRTREGNLYQRTPETVSGFDDYAEGLTVVYDVLMASGLEKPRVAQAEAIRVFDEIVRLAGGRRAGIVLEPNGPRA